MKSNEIVQVSRPDTETGLIIKESYVANSGLKYQAGLREIEGLKIVEGVSKGTGNIFLTTLMVFDEHSELIFDADVKKLTSYSREKVRQLVMEGLMSMLREAAENDGEIFDEVDAYEILDNKLKNGYYEQSRRSMMDLAKKWGVSFTNVSHENKIR